MTIRWQDKDPIDVIVVEFDFSADAAAVTSPVITVTVAAGTDPDPELILVGSPTIDGAIVRQRIQGGVSGVEYALQCQADNGSDRYTIEALLPVLTRPVVSTATARYVSEAQFERAFGANELTDLLSGGAKYAEVENAAAGLVDGYLAAKYTLPLVVVPEMLRGWAADITRFRLWDEKAPEEVRRRYEDAIAQLRDLARGLIALPPGADGTPASSPLVFDGYANDRVFTQDSLSCF